MPMKNKKMKTNFPIKSVMVSTMVILFFLAVIIFYYKLLYSETRERIIKSGELSAQKSSEQIDSYLAAGIHTVEIACYTLDNMIRDGRSNKEIKDFMNNQSVAVQNITDGSSPGLYGCINGKYLDGTGWTPSKGYDPTTRPWYIDARASIGRVAVVDPYFDLDSRTVMIALSKTLCDAKSVAAIDLSTDRLQSITEELASDEEADMEIIIDRKYQVIAHSANKGEIGRNYLQQGRGFGYALVEEMRASDQNYFSLNYDKAEYIVYTTKVANDWICLSVFDATAAFEQLKNMLFGTFLTAVLIILIQLFIMVRLNKKTQMAEVLNKKTERALAASEAKSSFLSNMSHEIRTPINAVLGMNEMVLRESTEANVLEYSESIRTAGHTLLGLVNDILDFSKIEAGKMEIIPVEYDISSLINDLVNMIQTKADGKGLLLKLEFDENIPKLLYGDEIRIKQVVTNILTNAVKYTEEGGVIFHIGYDRIPEEPDMVYLNFSVKDTGIGIKPEDMAKLFSKFDRIEEERNRKVEGTGLGMNITKCLLEMMGTSLEVDSVYGEGSDFHFKLKQKVTKWEPLGDYEAAYRAAVSGRKKYKEKFVAPKATVLVVDDTPMNLTVFVSLLKTTKVQIDTAESGRSALELTREKKYDVIFLDHMMPEMDGIETLQNLREEKDNPNLETPVICLTANAISGAREKYLAAGFDDYLTKPVEVDRLEEMLLHYLPDEKIEMTQQEESPEEAAQNTFPQWIWQCEGLDVAAGVQNCGGAEEFLSVLSGFYIAIKGQAEEIEEYLRTEDYRNYTIKVHALKSSARIIGAMELSEKAKRLEAAGDEQDIAFIKANSKELLTLYRDYLKRLAPIAETSEDLQEIPPEMLTDLYVSMQEFAQTEDYELAQMVMDAVKEYRLPEEDKERVTAIQACLQKLDWDGVRKIVSEANT